jgi:hypothetical protein|tara:strand:+ start:93 stop:233 length:141 start_codon:yes stop_codon:yes gene_type:complete
MQLMGIVLGISFAVACSVTAGMAMANYLIKRNNKCSCVKRWERINK